MGNTAPLIELTGIEFTYPGSERPVLDGLDFTVNPSSRIGLIGPNGSGKTSLFHVIMGLEKPSAGTIRIFGNPMKTENDFTIARRAIGLLFQDSDDQLFCPTVLDDVAFGALNLGRPPAEAREISLKTLESVGLPGFADRITAKLSGGEKRLVALASILSMAPKVLLLDEPTTGLDESVKNRLTGILNRMAIPQVIISHDSDFLRSTTTSLVSMNNGRIIGDGKIHRHPHDRKTD